MNSHNIKTIPKCWARGMDPLQMARHTFLRVLSNIVSQTALKLFSNPLDSIHRPLKLAISPSKEQIHSMPKARGLVGWETREATGMAETLWTIKHTTQRTSLQVDMTLGQAKEVLPRPPTAIKSPKLHQIPVDRLAHLKMRSIHLPFSKFHQSLKQAWSQIHLLKRTC